MNIGRKVGAVFIALLLAAVANVLIASSLLNGITGGAELIDVAGKTRMLSQKIAFEAGRILQGQAGDRTRVDAAENDFETALQALEHGGAVFGHGIRALSTHHRGMMAAIRAHWAGFRFHVDASIAAPSGAASPTATYARLAADAAQQLAETEMLVRAIGSEVQQKEARALQWLYGLLLFDVLALQVAFLALRKQLIRPLRELVRCTRELANEHTDCRATHRSADEIGQLATAFDHSAQRIRDLIARVEFERNGLRQAESMFRSCAENSVVGVYIVQNERFRFVNAKMADMFGYDRAEMVASAGVFDLVAEDDKLQVEDNIEKRLRGERLEMHYERRAHRRDGSPFDVEVFGSRMQLDGAPATIGIILEITEKKRLDVSLRVLSACNRALVRATDESSLLTEICSIVLEVSGYPFVWVGYAEHDDARTVQPAALAESVPGTLMSMISHVSWGASDAGKGATGSAIRTAQVVVLRDLQTAQQIAPWRAFIDRHAIVSAMSLPLKAGNQILGALTVYAQQDDTFHHDEVRVAQELADNLAYGIVALRAETCRRQYAKDLDYQARHDELTGLPNRKMLQDSLCQAIAQADRFMRPVWVACLDLDRFKFVNDSLGRGAGDALLNAVAARLRCALRDSDTVARVGADEFVLILSERMDEHLSSGSIESLREQVARPLTIEGQEFVLSCSIGVAVYPSDGANVETLIRHAAIAMSRVKETGRDNFQFFTSTMNERFLARLRTEMDLRTALEREQFVLHYQAQIDARSGRIVGMEALIRWQHPNLGMVAPPCFIGLAEETGLIIPIGAWVLRRACAQCKAWQRAGLGQLRIAVNLSARQFSQHDLVSSVVTILEETGLDPSCLELELTESLVMTDIEHAIGLLHEIKSLGVQVSLDDFGTGHSSLSYLKLLPIDTLKIDQSFVRDITHVSNDAAIVVSIISLAHNLQLKVIAEGVETPEQLAFLRHHGCDELQGYYFSKPIAADAVEHLLRRGGMPSAPLHTENDWPRSHCNAL